MSEVDTSIKLRKIYVPTPVSAALKTSGKATQMKDLDATLSGPVSAYSNIKHSDNTDNTIYLLFGDEHKIRKGACPPPCKDISDELISIDPAESNECWTISRLLFDIFNQAQQKGNYIDFYLEVPYLTRKRYFPHRKEIEKRIEEIGFLYDLFNKYYYCFTRNNCPWDTVRFNYIDIRLLFKTPKIDDISSIPEPLDNVKISDIILQYSLTKKISNLNYGNLPDNFSDINMVIKSLYGSENTGPLDLQLVETYLLSDNFTEDATNLMRPLLSSIDRKLANELYNHLIVSEFIVNRRGKNMHRVRAQLEALEHEGPQGKDLSKKISDYIIEKYITGTDYYSIYLIWEKLMKSDNPEDRKRLATRFRRISTKNLFLIVDSYLLARMFRTFPGTGHIPSNIKIIYTGNAHTDIYVDFLTKKMGVSFSKTGSNTSEILTARKDTNQCLKINKSLFLVK